MWSLAKKSLLATFTAAALVSAGGCGAGSVAADELSASVKAGLTEDVGQEPDEVTCPDDLAAEVGATTRCTLTHEGTSYGVTVTVTEVDGDDVDFDIEVDDEPME